MADLSYGSSEDKGMSHVPLEIKACPENALLRANRCLQALLWQAEEPGPGM